MWQLLRAKKYDRPQVLVCFQLISRQHPNLATCFHFASYFVLLLPNILFWVSCIILAKFSSLYCKNSILKLIPRQVFKWLATLSNSMTPPTLHLSHLNWCSVSKWPSNFNGLAVLNGSFFASSHHGQLIWFHKSFH